MSHLKALKLATAAPARTNDPVLRSREKMIAALSEQKLMVAATLEGRKYHTFRKVWRTNAEGQKAQTEALRRVRQGWFEDLMGKTFFVLRYAGKTIEIAKDKNAIEVSELKALPAILDTLIEAVRAGELDTQLAAASAERKKQLHKTE